MSGHHTRLNKIYEHMKDRCYNQKHDHYKYYGARGIGVCEEWRNNYKAFRSWALSHGYRDNLTLERIDVNKDYSPENCKWITLKAQYDNQRKSIVIMGCSRSLRSWCNLLGLSYGVIRYRLKIGYHIEDALELN